MFVATPSSINNVAARLINYGVTSKNITLDKCYAASIGTHKLILLPFALDMHFNKVKDIIIEYEKQERNEKFGL